MRIAITGGTGFVGRHLARSLAGRGHEVVLIARGRDQRDPAVKEITGATFCPVGTSDVDALAAAMAGCSGVAHCAGINREIADQTYRRVHVEGTQHVVDAARRAGVARIALLSFLRARPDCGSAYHESKWAAEQIVRESGLDYTILKSGVIYGKGDHLLDHLSHALHTFPVFAKVGLHDRYVRPVAVEDVVRVLTAALIDGRLSRQTVAVVGPEKLTFHELVARVAAAVLRRPVLLPCPTLGIFALAWAFEKTMATPLISLAQVRILAEGVSEPSGRCDPLPDDLAPAIRFTDDQICKGLPKPGRFTLSDCRCEWLRQWHTGFAAKGIAS